MKMYVKELRILLVPFFCWNLNVERLKEALNARSIFTSIRYRSK